MTDMNFIPSYRIVAAERRARIRRWAAASVGWAILLAALYACACALWGGGRVALADAEKRVAARIQESSQAIKVIQRELAAQNLLLRSSQVVENQPDWSLMLALLPRALSGDVVLKRCELRPDRPASPPSRPSPSAASSRPAPTPEAPGTAGGLPGPPAPSAARSPGNAGGLLAAALGDAAPAAEAEAAYLLRVAGCGKSTPAVLQFVQELERTGLFNQVRLVHTNPEVMQSLGVTGFQVECSLSASQEGTR